MIKNRTAFENSRKVTTIVFDKTETLTVGKFEVSKVVSLKKDLSENEFIRPDFGIRTKFGTSLLLLVSYKEQMISISIPITANFNAITGKGVEATVEGKRVKVVSPGYLKEKYINLPKNFSDDDSETIVFVIDQ